MAERPDETPAQRGYRLQKYNLYLKSIGRPRQVPVAPVRDHLGGLRKFMSLKEIQDITGISYHALSKYCRPERTTLPTEHADILLALTVPTDRLTQAQRGTATRRILQGLMALGFTGEVIAQGLDLSPRTIKLWRAELEDEPIAHLTVSVNTYAEIRRLAEKLEAQRPEDHGVPEARAKLVRTRARKYGYAPLPCWDWDTIGDPDVFPEWTGACGTEDGYRIHLRDDIPMCEPCKKSVTRGIAAGGSIMLSFSAWKFLRLTEKQDLSYQYIAKELGTRPETVRRWAMGEHLPQARYYDDLLRVFGVEREDLFDVGQGEHVYEDADFNRIKFRMMMEERDIGAHALSKGAGVSHTAVHNWYTGKRIPKIESIRKIADYFGVDWKVFYE